MYVYSSENDFLQHHSLLWVLSVCNVIGSFIDVVSSVTGAGVHTQGSPSQACADRHLAILVCGRSSDGSLSGLLSRGQVLLVQGIR